MSKSIKSILAMSAVSFFPFHFKEDTIELVIRSMISLFKDIDQIMPYTIKPDSTKPLDQY